MNTDPREYTIVLRVKLGHPVGVYVEGAELNTDSAVDDVNINYIEDMINGSAEYDFEGHSLSIYPGALADIIEKNKDALNSFMIDGLAKKPTLQELLVIFKEILIGENPNTGEDIGFVEVCDSCLSAFGYLGSSIDSNYHRSDEGKEKCWTIGCHSMANNYLDFHNEDIVKEIKEELGRVS